ncbi:MAG: FHA domain-containing protein [Kiritimatiellae bacterium]|nr:FHA domain-containing protein [Kiritimatiellia bacterium]
MSEGGEKEIHLIVEEGPDKGLEISVPPQGGRIGRSSSNDIKLQDGSLSRFHCRVFFKPDGTLWVADLGSTNQTLVNDKPIDEKQLLIGSRVTIGDTTLKVVRERLGSAPAPAAQPAAAPAPSAQPAPAAGGGHVDLGLGEKKGAAPRRAHAPRFLWLLASLMAAAAIAALALKVPQLLRKPNRSAAPEPARVGPVLEFEYEKVEAERDTIFRYHLQLQDAHLSVQIDDLKNDRHRRKDGEVDDAQIEKLADALLSTTFFDLKEEYAGLAPDAHYLRDLSITVGTRTHRVRVLNFVEPDEFKAVRKTIEIFGKNQLGLIALALPREDAIAEARKAMLQGQKLFGERDVEHGNLFKAIQAYESADMYLEMIDPKPDFYKEVVFGREESKRELEKKYQQYRFAADRAAGLKDWEEAARNLRVLLQLIPLRTDERHKAVQDELFDIERRLGR